MGKTKFTNNKKGHWQGADAVEIYLTGVKNLILKL